MRMGSVSAAIYQESLAAHKPSKRNKPLQIADYDLPVGADRNKCELSQSKR